MEHACVIGVPCDTNGETAKAYVVVKEGHSVDAEDIHAAVNQKLSSYKHLKGGIEFLEELPMTPSGKVMKKQLRSN